MENRNTACLLLTMFFALSRSIPAVHITRKIYYRLLDKATDSYLSNGSFPVYEPDKRKRSFRQAPDARLLKDAGIGASSPTAIAREFNRRYLGKPVTAQAVRKWLNGEAIPPGDKIRILAKWLKASPHWLHYGEGEKNAGILKAEEERGTYGEDAASTLPEDFQRLAPRHKAMVHEIVRALLRAEKH